MRRVDEESGSQVSNPPERAQEGAVVVESETSSTEADSDVAAALVVVGHGEADFSAVRNAQLEANRVLDRTKLAVQSWSDVARALNTVALRRSWKSDASRWGHVELQGVGTAFVERSAPGDRIASALHGLFTEKPSPPGVMDTAQLETDWGRLAGPVVAVLRSPGGEFSVLATGESSDPTRLASTITEAGAAVVFCSCSSDYDPRVWARRLNRALSTSSNLGELAKSAGEELEQHLIAERSFGILLLTNESVWVESSHDLVYGTAGSAIVEARDGLLVPGPSNFPEDALGEAEVPTEANSTLDGGIFSDAGPTRTETPAEQSEPSPSATDVSPEAPLRLEPTPFLSTPIGNEASK